MLLRQQKLEGTRFLRKGKKKKQNKTENEVTWDKVLKKRKKKPNKPEMKWHLDWFSPSRNLQKSELWLRG